MNNDNDVYDINKGIDLAGGNRKLALELISMLIAQLPVQKFEILESFNENDMMRLKQHVHKLHGSSQCCGTTALTIAVKEFENIIDRNLSNQLKSCKIQLLIEIDRVLKLDTSIYQ